MAQKCEFNIGDELSMFSEKQSFCKTLTDLYFQKSNEDLGEVCEMWFKEASSADLSLSPKFGNFFSEFENVTLSTYCDNDLNLEADQIIREKDSSDTVADPHIIWSPFSEENKIWSPLKVSPLPSVPIGNSTPYHLSISLGASLYGTDLSWSSSLATPEIGNGSLELKLDDARTSRDTQGLCTNRAKTSKQKTIQFAEGNARYSVSKHPNQTEKSSIVPRKLFPFPSDDSVLKNTEGQNNEQESVFKDSVSPLQKSSIIKVQNEGSIKLIPGTEVLRDNLPCKTGLRNYSKLKTNEDSVNLQVTNLDKTLDFLLASPSENSKLGPKKCKRKRKLFEDKTFDDDPSNLVDIKDRPHNKMRKVTLETSDTKFETTSMGCLLKKSELQNSDIGYLDEDVDCEIKIKDKTVGSESARVKLNDSQFHILLNKTEISDNNILEIENDKEFLSINRKFCYPSIKEINSNNPETVFSLRTKSDLKTSDNFPEPKEVFTLHTNFRSKFKKKCTSGFISFSYFNKHSLRQDETDSHGKYSSVLAASSMEYNVDFPENRDTLFLTENENRSMDLITEENEENGENSKDNNILPFIENEAIKMLEYIFPFCFQLFRNWEVEICTSQLFKSFKKNSYNDSKQINMLTFLKDAAKWNSSSYLEWKTQIILKNFHQYLYHEISSCDFHTVCDLLFQQDNMLNLCNFLELFFYNIKFLRDFERSKRYLLSKPQEENDELYIMNEISLNFRNYKQFINIILSLAEVFKNYYNCNADSSEIITQDNCNILLNNTFSLEFGNSTPDNFNEKQKNQCCLGNLFVDKIPNYSFGRKLKDSDCISYDKFLKELDHLRKAEDSNGFTFLRNLKGPLFKIQSNVAQIVQHRFVTGDSKTSHISDAKQNMKLLANDSRFLNNNELLTCDVKHEPNFKKSSDNSLPNKRYLEEKITIVAHENLPSTCVDLSKLSSEIPSVKKNLNERNSEDLFVSYGKNSNEECNNTIYGFEMSSELPTAILSKNYLTGFCSVSRTNLNIPKSAVKKRKQNLNNNECSDLISQNVILRTLVKCDSKPSKFEFMLKSKPEADRLPHSSNNIIEISPNNVNFVNDNSVNLKYSEKGQIDKKQWMKKNLQIKQPESYSYKLGELPSHIGENTNTSKSTSDPTFQKRMSWTSSHHGLKQILLDSGSSEKPGIISSIQEEMDNDKTCELIDNKNDINCTETALLITSMESKVLKSAAYSSHLHEFSATTIKKLKNCKSASEQAKTKLRECDSLTTSESSEGNLRTKSNELENLRTKSNELETVQSDKYSTGFGGFSTASGKHLKISKSALEQAKRKLGDCDSLTTSESSEGNLRTKSNELETVQSDKYSTGFGGFSTASGKKLKISKSALEQAKRKLGEWDSLTSESSEGNLITKSSELETVQLDKYSTGFGGFSTASGKHLKISKSALEQAKRKLGECDSLTSETSEGNLIMKSNELETMQSGNCPTGFGGFSTASGKHLKISKSALEQAKRKLGECDSLTSETSEGNLIMKSNDLETVQSGNCSTGFGGFSTASGKHLKISKSALEQAKRKLGECDSLTSETSEGNLIMKSNDLETVQSGNCSTGFGGFSTASGKYLKISKSALEQAKRKLGECDSLTSETSEGNLITKSSELETVQLDKYSTGFGGFSTASGKKLKISKSALEQAKRKLGECDSLTSETSEENLRMKSNELETVQSGNCSTGFGGFSTASGKYLKISKSALEQAKRKLGECDSLTSETSEGNLIMKSNDLETVQSGNCSTGFGGFSTASGKYLKISKSALEQAKRKLGECDSLTSETSEENLIMKSNDLETVQSGNCSTGFGGFSTASGKKLKISKSALEQAKRKLGECDSLTSETSEENLRMKSNELETVQSGNCSTGFGGFSTASGKNLKISKSALEQAKRKIGECDSLTSESSEENLRTKSNELEAMQSGNYSFQTVFSTVDINNMEISKSNSAAAKIKLKVFNEHISMLENKILNDDKDYSTQQFLRVKTFDLTEDCSSHEIKQSSNINCCKKLKPVESKFTSDALTLEISESTDALLADEAVICEHSSDLLNNYPKNSCHQPSEVTTEQNYRILNKATNNFPSLKIAKAPNVKPTVKINNELNLRISKFKTPFRTKRKANEISKLQEEELNQKRSRCENSYVTTSSYDYPDLKNMKNKNGQSLEETELHSFAKEHQDLRMKQQKYNKPSFGKLWMQKKVNQKISLQQFVDGKFPDVHRRHELLDFGLKSSVIDVSYNTAEDFRFTLDDFDDVNSDNFHEGVHIGDDATVIFGQNKTAGKEEFCQAFLNSPGVDSKLVTSAWIYNHYRWIVWKLAAMEKSFPEYFTRKCLTPNQVMLQLKYRYDKEIDHSERSCLKRIIERDDNPSKTMVLCVSDIIEVKEDPKDKRKENKMFGFMVPNQEIYNIELTDGWYCIQALLDVALQRQIKNGKIKIGQKLITSKAELIGPSEACTPLEAPKNLMLKLHANSTRRIHWNTKLGFYKSRYPFSVSVKSILPDGGIVSCSDMIIARVYPMQYMEKIGDRYLFHNEKAEAAAAKKHEQACQEKMEEILNQALENLNATIKSADVNHEVHKTYELSKKSGKLSSGKELYEALERGEEFESTLSSSQLNRLCSYYSKIEQEKQIQLQTEIGQIVAKEKANGQFPSDRVIKPFFKVLAVGIPKEPDKEYLTTITFWKPSAEVSQFIREGMCLRFHNLMASTARCRNQDCKVSLSTTSKTYFESRVIAEDILKTAYFPRKVSSFQELQNRDFPISYGEVDIVGIVVFISGSSNFNKNQTVYLADANMDIISIHFWGGVAAYFVEDVLLLRACVAGCNLQKRKSDSNFITRLYATDLSVFTQKPGNMNLKKALEELQCQISDKEKFIVRAGEKVRKLQYDYRNSGHDIQSPVATSEQNCTSLPQTSFPKGQKCSDLSGLSPTVRFHVTRKLPLEIDNSTDKNLENLNTRNSLIKNKIRYLERMEKGSLNLSPLNLHSNKNVKKQFRSPRPLPDFDQKDQ